MKEAWKWSEYDATQVVTLSDELLLRGATNYDEEGLKGSLEAPALQFRLTLSESLVIKYCHDDRCHFCSCNHTY